MTRGELEHVLRAAGAISGVRTWVVIGSQAILGGCPDAPAELRVSEEADLYAPEDEHAADLIDGSIGERSPFHTSFGYYAHGVGAETAVLPARWRERAISIASPATEGTVGICPHPCDLAISKLVAWREKDQDFVRALVRYRIVSVEELRSRLSELDAEVSAVVRPRIDALAR